MREKTGKAVASANADSQRTGHEKGNHIHQLELLSGLIVGQLFVNIKSIQNNICSGNLSLPQTSKKNSQTRGVGSLTHIPCFKMFLFMIH